LILPLRGRPLLSRRPSIRPLLGRLLRGRLLRGCRLSARLLLGRLLLGRLLRGCQSSARLLLGRLLRGCRPSTGPLLICLLLFRPLLILVLLGRLLMIRSMLICPQVVRPLLICRPMGSRSRLGLSRCHRRLGRPRQSRLARSRLSRRPNLSMWQPGSSGTGWGWPSTMPGSW
jgi:hypothetical protein